eukprot:3211759-Rhodomonas_salina.1
MPLVGGHGGIRAPGRLRPAANRRRQPRGGRGGRRSCARGGGAAGASVEAHPGGGRRLGVDWDSGPRCSPAAKSIPKPRPW